MNNCPASLCEAPAEHFMKSSDDIQVMKRSFDQAARIALDSPAEVLMIPENLSSEMVGPEFFELYMRD